MNHSANLYKRNRFPAAIIQYTVWLYHRFNLSHCDIKDLLAERGIEVSYESVRLWCNEWGSCGLSMTKDFCSADSVNLSVPRAYPLADWRDALKQ